MPIILWTDALIWIVVAALIGYAVYARTREHLVRPWRRVARSSAGLAAAVILAAYVVIGLVDSLHFRPTIESKDPKLKVAYAVEVVSVLDRLLDDGVGNHQQQREHGAKDQRHDPCQQRAGEPRCRAWTARDVRADVGYGAPAAVEQDIDRILEPVRGAQSGRGCDLDGEVGKCQHGD